MSAVWKAIAGKPMALPSDRVIGLKILDGADAGHVFILSKKPRITFGKAEADVDLKDPAVSPVHCALEVYEEVVVLRDLGSPTGTFVNDFQVREEILKVLDRFRIGNTTLQIYIKKKD